MYSLRKTVILLTLFSIAMGFMEAAVVIYLRELYYPGGFKFPLVPIPPSIALVEFLREAATLIMLITIGCFAGRNATQRFSFFLYAFAVWDLFYYVFLKVFLNWPESFFTPDILFLIPVPWVGPVIAPCIASFTMIVLMLMLLYYEHKNIPVKMDRTSWLLLLSGTLMMLASFLRDYVNYIATQKKDIWKPGSDHSLFQEFVDYVPQSFSWSLFLTGEALVLIAITYLVKRFRGMDDIRSLEYQTKNE